MSESCANHWYRESCGCFKPKYPPIKIGEQINDWLVVAKGSLKHNQQRYVCRCKCGIEREVAQQHLRTGASRSCIKCGNVKRSDERVAAGKYSPDTRRRYTKLAVNQRFDEQQGLCSLCAKPMFVVDGKRCFAWDHDHKTGEGRELLHRGCNVALGLMENNPGMLTRLIAYCEKYNIPK